MQKPVSRVWATVEALLEKAIRLFFRLVGKEVSQDVLSSLLQFIRFGIVGLSNTLVSYVIYTIVLMLLRRMDWLPSVDYYAAQIVAFVLSVLWSFYWNNKLVFTLEKDETRSLWKSLLKTYASYSFTGLFLNTLLLFLWVKVLHISEYVAPILNLIISVPLNFLINKYWAFRKEGN